MEDLVRLVQVGKLPWRESIINALHVRQAGTVVQTNQRVAHAKLEPSPLVNQIFASFAHQGNTHQLWNKPNVSVASKVNFPQTWEVSFAGSVPKVITKMRRLRAVAMRAQFIPARLEMVPFRRQVANVKNIMKKTCRQVIIRCVRFASTVIP